jgi:hypothetical protein
MAVTVGGRVGYPLSRARAALLDIAQVRERARYTIGHKARKKSWTKIAKET